MPSKPQSRSKPRRLSARLLAIALTLTCSGVVGVLTAAPGEAAITDTFLRVFSANTTGGIMIRGNTVVSCQSAATSCAVARSTSVRNNNDLFMTYVDVDSDGTTFDSSSSTVDVPTGGAVLYATLTWGGSTTAGGTLADAANGTGTGTASPTPASAGSVLLKTPGAGAYAAVASSHTTFLSGSTGPYQGWADVTGVVQAAGNGSYTLANVQTATGTNTPGGWALTIAYSNPTDPPRNLAIFRGFGSVQAGGVVDFPLTGFQTPPSGIVRTTLGAISYEGDAGSTGDQMQLGDTVAHLANVTDTLHPVGNSFISVISENGVDSSTRDPKYTNQLGYDASTINVDGFLPNNATSVVIRLTSAASGGETYYPGVVTFATDLYSPRLAATKAVSIVKGSGNVLSGVAEPGDTLAYTIDAANTGDDTSAPTVLTDTMPAGTTYVAGSLTSGGAGLTDVAADDIGSYDDTTKKITVNAGTGATSTVGGRVGAGASISQVAFRVTVNSGTVGPVVNTAALAYAGETTGIAVNGSSNTVSTPITRRHSALALTKSADVTRVQRGSTTVTYTLTVTNGGPYADPAVSVVDTLPAGAVVVSATPSSGSCTTPVGSVNCTLGAVANGGTATVAVTVNLDAAADPAADSAAVTGTNIDDVAGDNTASLSTIVNTPPTAGADSATTAGGTATVTVLGNDADSDGDTMSVAPGSTTPTKGTILVNSDKTITYTATAGKAGTDTFSYVVSDTRGGTATATVTITIPNALPVAVADGASTTPHVAVDLSVLANDTDANVPAAGQSLSVIAVTQPAGSKGTVTTNGTIVTFTPSVTFLTGTATFSYTVSDGAGGSDIATVTVTMADVGPVAVADTATTPYLTPVTVAVLTNDHDDNGDTLAITAVSTAGHGVATITGGSTTILYTPATGWSGTDNVTYTITDGSTTTTAVLTVTTGNGTPVATGTSITVDGIVTTSVNVLAHAGDPNGDTLTVTGGGPAAHGTVVAGSGGALLYTPDPTYAGPDSFPYTVSDGHGGTDTATVTITVRNQDPTAADDTAMVPGHGSVDVPVLGNDADGNGDTLTVTHVSTPAHGTASIRPDGSVRYSPNTSFLGVEVFAYVIGDGHGGIATAVVSVTVANQPPVASADAVVAAGDAGSAVTVDVLANDTDPNGDPLTIASVDSPLHGVATLVAGHIVYRPDATYAGPDSFSYTIGDGRGATSGATVSVDVQDRNPVAHADAPVASTGIAVTIDVLGNDTDADHDPLSLLSVDSTTAHGGTVVVRGGVLVYLSATGFTGVDSFSYVVSDGRGGSAAGTVSVHVANADPVAAARAATTATDTPVVIALLDGVTDADGQPVSIASAGPAGHGTVAVDAQGRVTYTPAPGWSGVDTFEYTVSDGQGGTTRATVTVTVADADPVTVDDLASTAHATPVTVDVLANDHDPNTVGGLQTLTVGSPRVTAGVASVTITDDGRIRVDPAPGFVGDVVVEYVVSDGAGGHVPGRLTVHVAAAPAPSVSALTNAVTIAAFDSSSILDPAASLTGHGAVTVMSVSQPSSGATVTVVDGRVVVQRIAGFVGDVTFDYVVVAADGTRATIRVTVRVLGESIGRQAVGGAGATLATSRTPAAVSATGTSLPRTGTDSWLMALAGLVLVGLGAIGVTLGRRRAVTASEMK